MRGVGSDAGLSMLMQCLVAEMQPVPSRRETARRRWPGRQMTMHTHETIAALIPHQGLMCLWEEVVEWDEERIVVRSRGHRDPAHPLRSGDQLHAVHLCEYGAQTMAVHGGLLAS